jgi:hypothetical protein
LLHQPAIEKHNFSKPFESMATHYVAILQHTD